MLAARNKGFGVTSRGRRLTLAEASRLQGLEPLTSRSISDSQLFGLLGNAMTRTVVGEVLRAALVSIGVTEFPDEKPPVTVSDRRPRPFDVPVGSRLYKIRGPKPFTYLEEGGVPHIQTFGGEERDRFVTRPPGPEGTVAQGTPGETLSYTGAVPSLGPPEQCEM